MKQSNYPIGDFLIRIKNAVLAKKHTIDVENNSLVKSVAAALEKEGYLSAITKKGSKLSIGIAYRKKEPLILDINLVSRPGLRVYTGVEDLKKTKGPKKFILSTPKGIMFQAEAIKKNLGGEIIAKIL